VQSAALVDIPLQGKIGLSGLVLSTAATDINGPFRPGRLTSLGHGGAHRNPKNFLGKLVDAKISRAGELYG
jgi:hypothetical protein